MHSEDERYQRGLGHGCSSGRMHSEDERYHGLGMDPLVIGCTWNTNVIMVWAWMLRLLDVLGTRTSLWFVHGCSGERMHSEHALLWFGHGCSGERMHSEHALLWFGHGCSGEHMHSEDERYQRGLGHGCSGGRTQKTNVVGVCAWILW